MNPTVTLSSQNGCKPETLTNGDATLNQKLRELHLLKTPERVRRPVYLGDDEDHSARPGRDLISPSPRQDERHRAEDKEAALRDMADSYRSLLTCIGEDPAREGLRRTPTRAAKAFLYFTKGYDEKIQGKTFFTSLHFHLVN